jgi:hypothetical protein
MVAWSEVFQAADVSPEGPVGDNRRAAMHFQIAGRSDMIADLKDEQGVGAMPALQTVAMTSGRVEIRCKFTMLS